MRRTFPALMSVVALAAAAFAASTPASAQGAVLDRPLSGNDAVIALGHRLSQVAATHDTTAETLRSRLTSDDSLWVDVTGRLFYVDPAPETSGATDSTSTTSQTLTRQFVLGLHSLPTAERTVYLDVDGFGGIYGGSVGKAWSRSYTGGDGVAEPYSLDADIDNFNADELADIYSIWQHVAEDFAPFAINVTTQEPTYEAINRESSSDPYFGTRVAITSTANSCGCGGVAYVGVFDNIGRWHDYYQPAFVYNRGAKYAAEAATHEAGHNLGLSHDGHTKDDGTTDAYYTGHGDWAPIMGVGYYEPIVQWSGGDYPGANNTEDDFVVAGVNGGPLRVDESLEQALPLGVPVSGVVGSAVDSDVFLLTAPTSPLNESGTVTMTVTVGTAVVAADLDIRLTLSTREGTEIAATLVHSDAVSADVARGMSATVTADLQPGSSYGVSVKGEAVDGPEGYSLYGSVGAYTVTATAGTAVADVPPDAPTGLVATANADGTISVRWTDESSTETAFELERWKLNDDGTTFTAITPLPLAADRTGQTEKPAAGTTWKYRLRAVNAAGTSALTAETGPVTAATTTTTKGGGPKK